MKREPDQSHYVRRVKLPSGKTIEVVYFDQQLLPDEPVLPVAPSDDTLADLHHCGTCDSDLVYPVDWDATTEHHWQVTLRCPNCEWSGTGVFEQEQVDAFDRELDRATETVLADLQRLTRANMELEVERFTDALARDLIVPDDF
jgi:hypothetical protein